MKLLKWLDKNFEEMLITLFMAWFTFSCIWQVIARFILQNSVAWTEETAKYSFIWMTFIGAAVASKKNLHVRVDILEHLVKGRARKYLGIICKVIFMVFTVIAAAVGIVVCQGLIRQPQSSPVLGLPMVWVYAALPVGMGLTTLRQLQNIILELLAMRRGRCSEKEKGGC